MCMAISNTKQQMPLVSLSPATKKRRTSQPPSWSSKESRCVLLSILLVFGVLGWTPTHKYNNHQSQLAWCMAAKMVPGVVWNVMSKQDGNVLIVDGVVEYLVPPELLSIHYLNASVSVSNLTAKMFDPLRPNWKTCIDIVLETNYTLDRQTIWELHSIITCGGDISDKDFERSVCQMGGPVAFWSHMWGQINHAYGAVSGIVSTKGIGTEIESSSSGSRLEATARCTVRWE